MAHDVYLSHPPEDQVVAGHIGVALERQGIPCWIASRQAPAGGRRDTAISDAVREARVMVVIFSEHSNDASGLRRELEGAAQFNIPIVPFRIVKVAPAKDLHYFLARSAWIDAFALPPELQFETLRAEVAKYLEMPPLPPAPPPLPSATVPGLATSATPPPIPVRKGTEPEIPPNRAGSRVAAAEEIAPTVLDVTGATPVSTRARDTAGTVLDARTVAGGASDPFQTIPETKAVGSFTTSLAAISTNKISVTIPEAFLAAGSAGTLLRLVPIECLRGKPPLEIYLKTGDEFTLGRSPEADLITAFFPRNEKNDLRSRRLSKIHARITHHDNQLWAHRHGNSTVQIGREVVGDDPGGHKLRERDQLVLAEDYALEIFYDVTLQNTLRFVNGAAWRAGTIHFRPTQLGAVRFEALNTAPAIRTSCWLFIDVGFGSARGGVITAGSELAPQQGVILSIGGCFWILNLVGNDKVAVREHRLASHEIVPLSQGDSVWLGAVRYQAEIMG